MRQFPMDYKVAKIPRNKRPKIRMLASCFGWDNGEEFVIAVEDETHLYFDDAFCRWTGVEKTAEGNEFVYIRKCVGE